MVVSALIDLLGPPLFVTHPEVRGVLFALGVALLAYAIRTARRLIAAHSPGGRSDRAMVMAIGEWGALFLLVSIGLFWAVGSYASSVGIARAQQIEASLATSPAVTLFSEKKLSLKAPGVLETPCSNGSAFQFRYEGLTLVLQSGNQYLFLPNSWTHSNGTAFLLPPQPGSPAVRSRPPAAAGSNPDTGTGTHPCRDSTTRFRATCLRRCQPKGRSAQSHR